MRYPKAYHDAARIQRRIMEVLGDVSTKDLANIAKGYATLETLKLRLAMKPAPKPVDVSREQRASGVARGGMA